MDRGEIRNLVLLGVLKRAPTHPYNLRKQVNKLAEFTGWKIESIYYPLKILEKHGFIRGQVNHTGKRSRRTYEVTPGGCKEFQRLINRSLLYLERPTFNIDLCLYFLDQIDRSVIPLRLKERLKHLRKIQQWVNKEQGALYKKESSRFVSAALERISRIVKVEERFTHKLVELMEK
jgi:DNA-binding PadR family transcriptional regulator